jgi:hypothetical protein
MKGIDALRLHALSHKGPVGLGASAIGYQYRMFFHTKYLSKAYIYTHKFQKCCYFGAKVIILLQIKEKNSNFATDYIK